MTPQDRAALEAARDILGDFDLPLSRRVDAAYDMIHAALAAHPSGGAADDDEDDTMPCGACSETGMAGPGLGDCGVCNGRGFFRKCSCINCTEGTGIHEYADVGPLCDDCWLRLVRFFERTNVEPVLEQPVDE